jgi:hypothetical protein
VYAHPITTPKAVIVPGALPILEMAHSCSVPKAKVPTYSKKQDAYVPGVRFTESSDSKANISVNSLAKKILSVIFLRVWYGNRHEDSLLTAP